MRYNDISCSPPFERWEAEAHHHDDQWVLVVAIIDPKADHYIAYYSLGSYIKSVIRYDMSSYHKLRLRMIKKGYIQK